jgi:hypothetical protein
MATQNKYNPPYKLCFVYIHIDYLPFCEYGTKTMGRCHYVIGVCYI